MLNKLNRKQRRSQYSSPSRSKPYCKPRHPRKKLMMVLRGREKIEKLIARGLRLNSKVIRPNPVANAVKRGLSKIMGG